MDHDDHLIDVEQLAAYLAVPVKTLYSWRYRKQGPPALRIGRHLRYRQSDVREWIDEQVQTGRHSTLTTERREHP
jgi:excisionase family DNA binding protein